MTLIARRGLSDEFMAALQGGVLSALLARVRADGTLCLEIREDYLNVYYRGGSLLRVKRQRTRYDFYFDQNYFAEPSAIALPQADDVAAWVALVPTLKDAMDLCLGRHSKDEREIQQQILRDNNFGGTARDTDYYVCDIEYASKHGRFDVVAVHWPSSPSDRKRDIGRRLVLMEVKQGDGALAGDSGLHAHIRDVDGCLAIPGNVEILKEEMLRVFNQKMALGLIDCGKPLVGFSDEKPLLVMVLVNHDPDKSKLRALLRDLPACLHADLAIASSSLMGYGLYDPGIMSVQEALDRFGDRI